MQPGELAGRLQVLATFLPILGPLALILIAMLLRGAARRMVAVVGPLGLGYGMWWLAPAIGYDGNMLGVLLYGAGMLAIGLYYAVFPFVAIGLWLRHNAEQRRVATAPPADGQGS